MVPYLRDSAISKRIQLIALSGRERTLTTFWSDRRMRMNLFPRCLHNPRCDKFIYF